MIVIGLTGSIGMGKTTAASMLRSMKIPVHDSDLAVHRLLERGGAGVVPVGLAFPEAYRKKTRSVDRRHLREVIGFDHDKWDMLETLLHPLVQAEQQEFLRAQKRTGAKTVALDIPLLFETGAEQRVDYTICVTAPPFLQQQRVLSRPGVTYESFAFRLSRQMPDEDKRRRADFVVQTGIGLAYTYRRLQGIVRQIRQAEGINA